MARRNRQPRQVRTNLTRQERRDPTAATQQLQWLSPGLPQIDRWNARRSVHHGYLASFVVARCVQLRAKDVAKLKFRTGPVAPLKPDDLPLTTPNSPLAQLAHSPAPEMTWRRLIEWLMVQRIVTGKMAAELELDSNGRPVAMWPLVSAELRPIPSKGGTAWFDRFEYGRTDQPRRLATDQILYDWDPAPDDFRQPYSALQSAQLDVSIAVSIGRYNYSFLRNDARPAAVVVTEKFATQDDFASFTEQFEGRHRGPENAGRVAFIETDPDGATPDQAVHIETLGISQKDARMLEMHQASLEHVSMALGVPWSKLSAADRTFDNANAEDLAYWESTVLDDVRSVEAAINAQLAPRLGTDVGWFDLSSVRALQPRYERLDAMGASVLVQSGIAGPEEVRPWFGLEGSPPASALPITPAAAPGAVPVAPAPADPALPPPADTAPVKASAPPVERRSLTAAEQETRRTAIWRRNDATVRALETAFAARWASYFDRQSAVVVAQVTGRRAAARLTAAAAARELRTDIPLGGPLDPGEIARWRQQALDLADLMHTSAAAAGVQRVNHAFGVSFDLDQPFVGQFIAARSNQLAGQVTDTTYQAVQRALIDGVGHGASIDDLAAAVRDVFAQASTNRARTIARTEVIAASNGSASLSAAQLPADVAAGQEWISTRDDRTRDDHAEADGQVVPMGASFDVGGEQLAYPGDPGGDAGNVINCRCTVAFLTPKDMEGRGRVVPLVRARAVLALVDRGEFDEARVRRALETAA